MSGESHAKPFRAGMELDEPASFTPPQVRPGPPQWEKYHPPRFSRRVRILITVGLWAVPACFVVSSVLVAAFGAGVDDARVRAVAALFLMALVPMAPFLYRATRDLWGSQH